MALLGATAAMAEDRPLIQPSRDVSVTYRVEGAAASVLPGGIPNALLLSWDAAGQRLRAAPEGRSEAVIVDLRAHSAELVDTALRSALKLPTRESDFQPLTLEGAHLTRRNEAVIAGLPCTNWAVQSSRGNGTICLTADGVPLRADGAVDGQRGAFTASSVNYAPVRDDLFRVPADFMQFSLPKFGRVK